MFNPFDEKNAIATLTTLLTGISSLDAHSIYLRWPLHITSFHSNVMKLIIFHVHSHLKLKSTFSNGSCSTACIVLCFAVLLPFVHISIIIIFAFRIWDHMSDIACSDYVCTQRFRYSVKKASKKESGERMAKEEHTNVTSA